MPLLALAMVGVSLTAGCGGESTTPPPPPPPPVIRRLVFVVQPAPMEQGIALSPAPRVAVQDASGNVVSTATGTISIALGGTTAGATLGGVRTADLVNGVATFPDLVLDRKGTGYALVATGNGFTEATSEAFTITRTFAEVTAGGSYTCARTAGRFVYCWGSNAAGELGDGTTGNRATMGLVGSADFRATQVSAGSNHACSLGADGAAHCWGSNSLGRLGDGTTTDRRTPTRVVTTTAFVSISAGYSHTCGLTVAGAALCWGDNGYGQLGDGTLTERLGPVQVVLPASTTLRAIQAGFNATCGVDAQGGAWCWGTRATLGGGSTADQEPLPKRVVAPGVAFSAVAIFSHACGTTVGGPLYCWGPNVAGVLGDGTDISRVLPAPVAASPGTMFATAVIGGLHSCAVSTAGALFCWGANGGGQLGDGNAPVNQTRPQLVTIPGETILSAAAGAGHSCALSGSRQLYCWGLGSSGQLGGGLFVGSATPTRVTQ